MFHTITFIQFAWSWGSNIKKDNREIELSWLNILVARNEISSFESGFFTYWYYYLFVILVILRCIFLQPWIPHNVLIFTSNIKIKFLWKLLLRRIKRNAVIKIKSLNSFLLPSAVANNNFGTTYTYIAFNFRPLNDRSINYFPISWTKIKQFKESKCWEK